MIAIEELKILRIPVSFEIDKTFDDSRFIRMRLRIQHDNINPNFSEFDLEDIKHAAPSLANTPILANVIWDNDGNPQFGGHDTILERDKVNGEEYREIYIESPIGVIPANDIGYEIKEYKGKNHVYANAYIYRKISNYAEDVILRDSDIKLSMEIEVNEFVYNANTKIYKIKDYKYTGITFLNNNFGTGMEHALATTNLNGEFSLNNNQERFLFLCNELQDALKNYKSSQDVNIDNKFRNNEGGNTLNEKLELLKSYNLKQEDLNFSIDDLSLDTFKNKLKVFMKTKAEEKFVSSNTFISTYKQKKGALENALSPVYESNGNGEIIAVTHSYLYDFDNDHVYVDKVKYTQIDMVEDFGRQLYVFDEKAVTAKVLGDFERMVKTYMTIEDYDAHQANSNAVQYSEDDMTKIKDAFEAYKAEYTVKDSDVAEFEALKEYKAKKEAEEFKIAKNKLIEQFAEIKNTTEFDALIKNDTIKDLHDLEKELAFLYVKKTKNNYTSVQTNKPKSQFSFVPLMTNNVDEVGSYDDLFVRYGENN